MELFSDLFHATSLQVRSTSRTPAAPRCERFSSLGPLEKFLPVHLFVWLPSCYIGENSRYTCSAYLQLYLFGAGSLEVVNFLVNLLGSGNKLEIAPWRAKCDNDHLKNA